LNGQPSNLLIEKKDGIAKVQLNRPEAMNVMNQETLEELLATFQELGEDKGTKVVILGAMGDKAFTAGADITHMGDSGVEEAYEFTKLGHAVARTIETEAPPTIAAIHGYVFGGGVEIVSACDIRIAADNTVMSQPEINIGIIPGWGGTQRLIRHVGPGRAKEMIYTGKRIDAKEALEWGLVNKVVPRDKLDESVWALAEEIAQKSRVILMDAKRAINATFETSLERGLDFERTIWANEFATEDQKEGMKAFLERRKPIFKDR